MAISWRGYLRSPDLWPAQDAILSTEDLTESMMLEAYLYGAFPMPLTSTEVWWWSPRRRGVLPLGAVHVSRSLRQSCKRYRVTVDQAFDEVIERCADPSRDGAWIDGRISRVSRALAGVGRAHSIEVWTRSGQLAGGLYGIAIGGLFAGESMFHDREVGRDASKVALVHLVEHLRAAGDAADRVLDVQWSTPHLASLGAVEIPRSQYLRRLRVALRLPDPWDSTWAASREESRVPPANHG